MCVVYVQVCALEGRYPQKLENGTVYSRAGVARGCEFPLWVLGMEPRLPERAVNYGVISKVFMASVVSHGVHTQISMSAQQMLYHWAVSPMLFFFVFKKVLFKRYFIYCVHVSVGVCVPCHTCPWSTSRGRLSPFTVTPGIEIRLSVLQGKYLCLMSKIANPIVIILE